MLVPRRTPLFDHVLKASELSPSYFEHTGRILIDADVAPAPSTSSTPSALPPFHHRASHCRPRDPQIHCKWFRHVIAVDKHCLLKLGGKATPAYTTPPDPQQKKFIEDPSAKLWDAVDRDLIKKVNNYRPSSLGIDNYPIDETVDALQQEVDTIFKATSANANAVTPEDDAKGGEDEMVDT
ncbi:hypothetical protein B0H19DRAFT_1260486 [Mycena capillaripes]|nr:hypothetical protein B0H19DRAFT_1260486 [Mycena capillaripes]